MEINIKCYECGQCNRKGKPSVMRGSAYCDSHRKFGVKTNRIGLFQRFKDFMFEKRYNDQRETEKLKIKGFRPSWFWRR